MESKSLNILICSYAFFPDVGGIENLSLFLIQEFIKDGHKVSVITSKEQEPEKRLSGVEIAHVSAPKSKQLAMFREADIVFMPNITLRSVWLFLFDRKKKWVISHNDFSLFHTSPFKRKLKEWWIKRANGHIAVSQSLADALPIQSRVIHNCYDDTVFFRRQNIAKTGDIVFVGRLVSQKGCDVLINACSQLEKNFSLGIIGDGPEMENLKELSNKLGLTQNIQFWGAMQGNELAEKMNEYKIMVVPSLYKEGFGIVALEGLACDCRLIVSDSGGLKEAAGDFSPVFSPGDYEKLSEHLQRELSREKDENGLQIKNKFLSSHTRNSVAEQYIQYFNQIIQTAS